MDDRLTRLLALLDVDEATGATAGTSVRLPVALREAAGAARELGLDRSTTSLAVDGLRGVLEGFATGLVLEARYREQPHLRPELWELAQATAELDGDELGGRPDLLQRAAEGVVRRWPLATPDDVLRYAAGLQAGGQQLEPTGPSAA